MPDDAKILEVSSMEWLEWSSVVIGSTAWPIATIVVALVYRGQISQLLERIRGAKYGNTEVYFSNELDKIEAQVSEPVTNSQRDADGTLTEASKPPARNHPVIEKTVDDSITIGRISDQQDRFSEIARLSPSAAVLDAWRDVELELDRSFRRSGISKEKTNASPFQLGVKLYRMGVIHEHTMDMIRDLQNLRNAAAHTEGVSMKDAYRFKTLAFDAIQRLKYDIER